MIGIGTQLSEAAVLTFDEALARLWVQHPELHSGVARVAVAEYEISAAYTGYLPYLSLSMAKGGGGRNNHEARLVMPLWKGGLTPATVDAAKAGHQAAEFDLKRTHLDLAVRLIESWFAVLSAREQQGLWQEYLSTMEQLQGLIERRTAAGVSTESEVMNIVSRIRQAEAEAAMNDSQLDSALVQYHALLGPDFDVGSWPPSQMLLSDDEAQAAPDRALLSHPELQLAMSTVTREKAEIRVSKSSLSPEVSLQYVHPFGDQYRNSSRQDDGYLQLAVQYQTDTSLRSWYGYQASGQRLVGAQANLDTVRRQVLAWINADQAERRAALTQIEFQRDAVTAADAVTASSRRQFEAGRKTWIEVLNAQREAHDTRLRLVEQRRVLWQANMRLALNGLYWERLLGLDSIDLLEQPIIVDSGDEQ